MKAVKSNLKKKPNKNPINTISFVCFPKARLFTGKVLWALPCILKSRSRSRSHKRAYDLVKIEYRSRKRSHKLDGIGVGRIRMFPFLPIPFTTPEAEAEDPSNREARNRTLSYWFILPLLLATPTMQFSLDRKRRSHKQNQCSASDSVGLISLDRITLHFLLRLCR